MINHTTKYEGNQTNDSRGVAFTKWSGTDEQTNLKCYMLPTVWYYFVFRVIPYHRMRDIKQIEWKVIEQKFTMEKNYYIKNIHKTHALTSLW